MSVPYWVQDAIFYQIFPDRFYRAISNTDAVHLEPWGATPTHRGFQGGNIRGIIEKIDYLLDLGVNALYLNPIFSSSANHRYHTNDYFKIDRTLGTMEDYKALLDAAHSNGMRVIIDGVFNHSGRGFFAFTDLLDNGPASRYIDWYYVHGFPLEAFSGGKSTKYKAWWDIKDLPKLKVENPAVQEYLLKVSRYWIEQGTDGWRLDVPAEIDNDAFWAEFRRVVNDANPDAYTVGEIWDGNPRWVGDTHFNGLMHYTLRDAITDLLGYKITLAEFVVQMEGFLGMYPRENVYAMYLVLGSHDTRRLMTKLNHDINKVRLAFLLQFSNPGAPAIYYGDEIGMEGEKDPDNRRAFPWNESAWDLDLRAYVQRLIAVRKHHPALRRGDLQHVHLSEENHIYAFSRGLGEDKLLVVINGSKDPRKVDVPVSALNLEDGALLEDVVSHEQFQIRDQKLHLPFEPWGGMMLCVRPKE